MAKIVLDELQMRLRLVAELESKTSDKSNFGGSKSCNHYSIRGSGFLVLQYSKRLSTPQIVSIGFCSMTFWQKRYARSCNNSDLSDFS